MSQSVKRRKTIIRQSQMSRDKQYSSQKFSNNASSTATSNHYDEDSESDKYYTASSCEDFDGEDDEPCICIDSSDEDKSLSELHIDLKTLQAVSSMLSHYSPVIQSDAFGNPIFVPPPPPPEDYYEEERKMNYQIPSISSPAVCSSRRLASEISYSSTIAGGDDDCLPAVQELDDFALENSSPCRYDSVSELSDVMEKLVKFSEEMNKES